MSCLVICRLGTTHRAGMEVCDFTSLHPGCSDMSQMCLGCAGNIWLMPCCMSKQRCGALFRFGTLWGGPIRTTLTPCLMSPTTTASIATLLPAVAKICPPAFLSLIINPRATCKKWGSRVGLPVPGGPCQIDRVWVRAVLKAAAWWSLTPPVQWQHCRRKLAVCDKKTRNICVASAWWSHYTPLCSH